MELRELLLVQADWGDFTAGALVAGDRVVEAAPALERFVGQPVAHLTRWVLRQGGRVTVVCRPATRVIRQGNEVTVAEREEKG